MNETERKMSDELDVDWSTVTWTQLIEAIRKQKAAERDWPEDFGFENGNYQCRCVFCGEYFTGHKRRFVCKSCDGLPIPSEPPNPSATSSPHLERPQDDREKDFTNNR